MLSGVKSLYLIFCGSVQTPATPDMTGSRLTRWAVSRAGNEDPVSSHNHGDVSYWVLLLDESGYY